MNYRKIAYYARNIALDVMPKALFRQNLEKILGDIGNYDVANIVDRVSYYNKIGKYIDIDERSPAISQISLKKSFYYYDMKEHARYFPPDFRLNYEFGDVRVVPDVAMFVKSRPIHARNENSLVMKLEKFRHFYFPPDINRFEDKRPIAVWRGGEHNPKRVALMNSFRGHRLCDVGYTHVPPSDPRHSAFLRPTEQMAYKYVISIEGNDVATNLKWILASNSLCIMPAPVYETWFMEGRLRPDEDYVRVADDFADLEDKILYYERHPAEAQEIIRNANRHAAQFLDEPLEQLVSLLVMYKYFIATRQIEPDPAIAELIWP
jgi:hypothetical protein